MNSSYGKTIEKPTETEIKIIKNEDFDKYFQKNYNKIIEAIDMNDKFKLIKVRKQINNHFNFSLLGIQVLSMSKRIMNEVMCLAYDLKCHVYYQDTGLRSIRYAKELKGGLMNLYKSLFDGNEEKFDLTYGQPSFNMKNNFTVETRKIFIRTTKTTYEEGKRNEYFL